MTLDPNALAAALAIEIQQHGDSMTLTPERISEIKVGTKDVTPGPWLTHIRRYDEVWHNTQFVANTDGVTIDAAHIANCDPQTISELCDLALEALSRREQAVPGDQALREAAMEVVKAYDENSGAEPSQSVLDRAIDLHLRAAVPSEQEPVAWRCGECGCLTFARIEERGYDGHFHPGPTVRCVSCKVVSYWPEPTHPAPAAGVKVLRDALQAVVDEVRNVASASYIREPVLSQVIAALEAVAQ